MAVIIVCAMLVGVERTFEEDTVVRNFEAFHGCIYVVQRGDTLFRIGARYGVSFLALAEINGIPYPDLIFPGMVLSVPCHPYTPPPPPPPLKPATCEQGQTYTVKRGDNLFRIALNYGTTVNALRDANDLWNKVLHPGRVLAIPCANALSKTAPIAPAVAPTNAPSPTTIAPSKVAPQNVPPTPVVSPTVVAPTTETAPPVNMTPIPIEQPTTAPQTVPEGATIIKMQDGKFDPVQVRVPVGTTVVWENAEAAGGATYSVTSGAAGSPNNYFDSGAVMPGENFQFTFSTLGVYDYYSKSSPTMIGQVVVISQ